MSNVAVDVVVVVVHHSLRCLLFGTMHRALCLIKFNTYLRWLWLSLRARTRDSLIYVRQSTAIWIKLNGWRAALGTLVARRLVLMTMLVAVWCVDVCSSGGALKHTLYGMDNDKIALRFALALWNKRKRTKAKMKTTKKNSVYTC